MTDLARVAALVFNRPHHITEAAGEAIANVIREKIVTGSVSPLERPDTSQDAFVGKPARDRDGRSLGYRTEGSVAIIDMRGELVNRGAWVGASSGLVSYEGLRKVMTTVRKESAVRSVVIDVDSPGGEATGMIEASDALSHLASVKPVYAVANGLMCSAAYGICSRATKIIVSPTSMVGSIGTLWMHLDRTGEMEQRGWKVTVLRVGDRKARLNSVEPLSADVRREVMSEMVKLNDMFVSAVAEGRGITEDAVRATEARVYLGQDAVDAGLADAVGSFEMALGEARASSYKTPKTELVKMTNSTARGAEYDFLAVMEDAAQAMRQALDGGGISQEAPAAPAAPPAPAQTAPAPAPVAASPAPAAQAADSGEFACGFQAATERVRTILQANEAKTRPGQAQVLALETEMSASEALKVLAMLPDDAAAAGNRTTQMYNAIAAQGGNARVPHQGGAGETLESDTAPKSTLRSRMGAMIDKQTGNRNRNMEAAR